MKYYKYNNTYYKVNDDGAGSQYYSGSGKWVDFYPDDIWTEEDTKISTEITEEELFLAVI